MNLIKKICFIVIIFNVSSFILRAQVQTFPTNGAPNPNHNYYAFSNCTLHVDASTIISNATLLIKDGQIIEVAEKVTIPAGSVTVDLKGKHIYPSFIEMYSDYGMPEAKPGVRNFFGGPQMESNIKGAYGWNQAIKADVDANKNFANNETKADELRKLGFGTVLTSTKDGIVRGSGALVLLNTQKKENENVVKDKAAAFYSFSKGSSTQDYPSSLMGSIALLRQTYLDAQWYIANKNKAEYNISLEAFNNLQTLPSIIEVSTKLSALRADKIGDEFKVKYIIKGSGDEYQRIHDLVNTNCKFIIPLNFPDAFDVEDPYDAELISTAELKHWEMAPANTKFMQDNSIPFAITTSDLKDKTKFWKNLRKAIQYGLTEQNALKNLTTVPAEMLGVSDKIGALKKGMLANFIITSKNVFEEGATIYENWVNGNVYKINDLNAPDIRGKYELSYNNIKYKIEIGGEIDKLNSNIILKDTIKSNLIVTFKNNNAVFYFNRDSVTLVQCQLNYNAATNSFIGKAESGNSAWFDAIMIRSGDVTEKKKDEKKKENPTYGEVFYPFSSYGRPEKKEDLIERFKNRLSAILIKKATVWTNDSSGILKEHDVYIVEGKIVRVAPNIDAPKTAFAKIIDGKGKHLTAGIIDEHSHIAISEGVNEGTQSSSAEVRIGDVVNSEDINIYRQLSGGVTAAHLLHGSANAIGGQTQLIKLRWGLAPEEMKYEKWDGFIKFALGENVKQSNWGEMNSIRFPQTRMGVEQVYYDYFTRAKEYEAKWKVFSESKEKNNLAPRRDLELDALVEILNKKRFITCHSYVKSEIDMLMHVGDSMGFKVNTFTHILEGYKVADKMKAHGAAASTFSDWWAYKMEVMDAIPYNSALLMKMGIVTAVNSDDAEMGRRLNQEAAKAVKYGALSEEEAWKLCTLNPAKMLHVDDKVGTVKAGKVADVVLWSDNPLSINAKVEKTIIDGIIYYDSDEDAKMREEIKKERARIIAKMIKEKQNGATTQKPSAKKPRLYHCDTMENEELGIKN
ncbi:MAG TPA: amidohydrolase family protein [Bacteroidia bacterium]|jgi:imidazolonepropionase-like amidohydrolase|nr:amidohydrolase family protein [Bacteroidia bacterium]